MLLNVGHQETKTNQHHHIDILIHGVIGLVDISLVMRSDPNKEAIEYHNYYFKNNNSNGEFMSIILMYFEFVFGKIHLLTIILLISLTFKDINLINENLLIHTETSTSNLENYCH